MATRNKAGASTHPWRMPDVVVKRFESFLPILIVAPVCVQILNQLQKNVWHTLAMR